MSTLRFKEMLQDEAEAVASFNKRAIQLYEKAGFVKKHSFIQATNGGRYEFTAMENKIVRVKERKI
ncbi:hypothetical protein [Halobacillus litoralis]|uniref:hypothetical protein n=1 Tax=Halobacillus litoralis TaxID=45668 RepID=UPI001CFD8FC4|nr:hypothetical protein [Halobacillus litoralis]